MRWRDEAVHEQESTGRGEGATELTDCKGLNRAFTRAREQRAGSTAQCNACQEARDHYAKRVEAAAEHVTQHSCPEHFVKERDRAGGEHQRENPECIRHRARARCWRPRWRPVCLRADRCEREDDYVDEGCGADALRQSKRRQQPERSEERAPDCADGVHRVEKADVSTDVAIRSHGMAREQG